MIRRSSLLSLVLCLGLTPGLSPAGANDPRPFRGQVAAVWDNILDGRFTPPAHFEGGGPVTHMGETTQS